MEEEDVEVLIDDKLLITTNEVLIDDKCEVLIDEKYKTAYTQMRNRPYYDQAADEQASTDYYANIPSPPTYESLHTLLSTTYTHAKRRQNLFSVIDRRPDWTLRCVYSDELLEDENLMRIKKCNEEHCLPQSWHEGSLSHPGADMHQLFASYTSANSFRKNLPYGQTSSPPHQEKQGGKIYQSENQPSLFLPQFNKGACARATLYIFVAYKGTVHPERFPRECLPWLIQTAVEEPVTLWEKHRNAELFRLQGNRNPFIDHPEWASVLDFTEAFSNGREATKQAKEILKKEKREAKERRRSEKLRQREQNLIEKEKSRDEREQRSREKEQRRAEKNKKREERESKKREREERGNGKCN